MSDPTEVAKAAAEIGRRLQQADDTRAIVRRILVNIRTDDWRNIRPNWLRKELVELKAVMERTS